MRENKQRGGAFVAGMKINTVVGKRGGRPGKINKREGMRKKGKEKMKEREREESR